MIHSIHEYTKDPSAKSKYILKRYSGVYAPLHEKSKTLNEIPLYVCPSPSHINAREERKPSLILVNARKKYLSGLYFPQVENPFMAYGDIGNDALLVIVGDNRLEVIVFPESKHLCHALYSMYSDTDRDMLAEIETHRQAMKQGGSVPPESLT